MKRALPAWVHGVVLGVCCGTLLWIAIDTTIKDTTAIGLALSAGLALAIAHIRTTKVNKRRAWVAGEAAANAPVRVS